MTGDSRALSELLEESQDLQADALRPTRATRSTRSSSRVGERATRTSRPTAAFHAAHREALSSSFAKATLLGAAGGAALVGVLASAAAAAAASTTDVQILQTAASIENLAVATYKTALTLPYIGGSAANPVVTKFAQVTMGQHVQHGDAFNAAARSLGGKTQSKPDPAFVPVVNKAVASLNGASASQGALGVVGLAMELENIAAETYSKDTVLATKVRNKALFASVMGIEAQHVSVLLAVQALLMAGAPRLISLAPGTAAALPAAAGSVGFPMPSTRRAAPPRRGKELSSEHRPQHELRGQRVRARCPDEGAGPTPSRPRDAADARTRRRAMRGSSRRTFLLGAGAAVAGGAALVAIGTPALTGMAGSVDPPTGLGNVPTGRAERRPGGGCGGGQHRKPGRVRLHGRAQRGGRGQAGHGPPGGGQFRHDGQGSAPAARGSLERGPQVSRQGAGHGDQPEAHAVVQADFAKVSDVKGWPSWP